MFAIEIHLLTGRYSATSFADRNVAEWPPHPARLYSAMVAAWADHGEDQEERRLLEWFESLPAPTITFSDVARRRPVTHFVPVNDASVVSPSMYERRADNIEGLIADIEKALEKSSGRADKTVDRLHTRLAKERNVDQQVQAIGTTPPSSALELLPEGRVRQARVFPSVAPHHPVVTFGWDEELSTERSGTLDTLLTRVTRLGHSSSLVACRVSMDIPEPTLVPGEGTESIRWVGPGQLAALEEMFLAHRGSRPRVLPFKEVRYGPPSIPEDETPRSNLSGRWFVFELDDRHRRFRMVSVTALTKAIRNALLAKAPDPLPEGLTGHTPDGSPSRTPHVAVLGLPFVGYEHADGSLKGFAIVIPDSIDEESLASTLRAIGEWREKRDGEYLLHLTLGKLGTAELRQVVGYRELSSLSPGRWGVGKPSYRWTSVTPIALPTHPGDLRHGSPATLVRAWAKAEQAVRNACVHVGLPEPVEVVLSDTPFVQGSAAAGSFPAFLQNGPGGHPTARRLIHASIRFPVPVEGPVILGSGRYLGLGLMIPETDEEPENG